MLYVTANRIKDEELFNVFSSLIAEPSDEGRRQFFEMISYGKKPDNPDPYYLKLCSGKKWFNVQQADIKKSFGTREWVGWYCYWKDFKGERWMLKSLMAWHPSPPEWIFNEEEPPDYV